MAFAGHRRLSLYLNQGTIYRSSMQKKRDKHQQKTAARR
jgi:hypothetical protein